MIREAGAFIACLSQISVKKNGYVQTEFRLALTAYGEKAPGTVYFIPVKLDECEIPDLQIANQGLSIRNLHWLNLWQEGGFEQLIRALEKDVGTTGRVFCDIDALWCPEMVALPKGEFLMGSSDDEEGCYGSQSPQHPVTIDRRLAIGRYTVTFEEYDHFCEATKREKPEGRGWGRGQRPVINVSWRDAVAFCAWLANETGQPYRLPSEAEWEYAARAGTTTRYAFGDAITPRNANYVESNLGKTTEVGAYSPNFWAPS